MDQRQGVPRIASLLSDPARLMILRSLVDGTRRPAGELAYAAHISPQAASGHLAKLVDGGLLSAETQGRHRYYRIATPEVAEAIESFATPQVAHAIESFAARSAAVSPTAARKPWPPAFVHARTCYDHLAGEVAVAIADAMVRLGWLARERSDFTLTPRGGEALAKLGIDAASAASAKRTFARGCVDLTQRRLHLGGGLGAALLELYVSRRWIRRSTRSRAVTVTAEGREALAELLGIAV